MYDVALLDSNTFAHQLYRKWPGAEDYMPMADFILHAVEAYSHIPFIKDVKTYIWIGDGKPYFRKLNYQEYKSNRPPKEDELTEFLRLFNECVNSFSIMHFEADDLIAGYVRLFQNTQKILIVTVDSDLLQLIGENVDWCCSYGFYPQLRSIHDGTFTIWLENKFKKLSKKRIGHLDTNCPLSIIEWKVEYGDTSDNIKPGEDSRWLIDLRNPPEEWDVLDIEGFGEMFEEYRRETDNTKNKISVYHDFNRKTGTCLPTSFVRKIIPEIVNVA
jgi:5'-3' exonuclease